MEHAMKQQMRLTQRRAEAFKAIRNLSGNGQRTVSEAEWRQAYYDMTPASGENKRQSFRRAMRILLVAGAVQEVDYFEYALAEPDTRVTNEHKGA